MAHINKEELLDRVDHDKELLADLVEIFIEDGGEQLNYIKIAVETNDADALERSSHSFKGSAKNMAAGPLADIAQKLETAGKEADLSNANALLDELQKEFDQTVPELKNMIEE